MSLIPYLHALAGLIVLIEGLNKLERTDILAAGLSRRERVVVVLKAAGWAALVVGAAGALANPFLPNQRVDASDVLAMAGFALLVVRSRVREVPAGERRIESDEFERTVVLNPETVSQMRAGIRASKVLPDPYRDRIEAVLLEMEQRQ